jgi:hypothetical protein
MGLTPKPILKIVDHAQEQDASRRESAAYRQYVSILRRLATKLWGVRCIFKIGFKLLLRGMPS